LKQVGETGKKEIEFAAAEYYGSRCKESSRFVCGGPAGTFPYILSLVRTLHITIRSVGGKPTDGRYVDIFMHTGPAV
jgi:hypothetical protein